MRAVVLETEYTGPRVRVKGYEIGGKTGTAEMIDEFGQYQKDVNMASFIGVFPVSMPKYLVLAMIENPKKILTYIPLGPFNNEYLFIKRNSMNLN